MHLHTILLPVFLNLATAALNGHCVGAGNQGGVCVSTGNCERDGGKHIVGACPNDPDDIRCCTKPTCGTATQKGVCKWTSSCKSGETLTNFCPGPANYKCCLPDKPDKPEIPSNSTGPAGNSTAGAGGGGPAPPKKEEPKKEEPKKEEPKKEEPKKEEPDLGEKILAKAKEQEGTQYVFGGGSCKGPTNGGLDCSGLVSWAICQVTKRDLFGENLRVTWQMYCASEKKRKYKKVKYEDRKAGDLVFFGGKCDCSNGGENSGVHHVGLMMNSKTLMWNALKTGTRIRKDDFGDWGEKACPFVIRVS